MMSGEHPFLEKMEDLQSGYKNMGLWNGADFDIMRIAYNIASEVKQYFPINEVPEEISYQIKLLKECLERSEAQLNDTLDTIIIETQKFDGLE